MSRVKSLNSFRLVFASILTSVLVCACSGYRERAGDGGVWFVHATDPHVYLYLKKPGDANEKAIWDYQQKLDAETFKTFLQALATLPQKDGPPAFLLITGDFGVDPCLNLKAATPATTPADAKDCLATVDDKERASRVDALADLLAASPIPDIYFVAGNNDLPLETADDAGLGYFNQFFQDVQSKITAKNANVRLHNLTGCYGPNAGAISNCSPDIPGTPYRMIGFPSQSFKNKDTKYASNQTLQSAQYKTFRGFFDQAAKDAKKVIIATHIPEMDDPYFLARDRYAGVKPDPSADTGKDNSRSAYSTWNVEKSLLDDWAKVLASDSLIALLAGHLHDDHKEIYQQPYSWSTLKEHQLGYRKLFLAPPLSVKNQDGSPIQARGFSIVSLKDHHLSNRFYWFDGLTRTFNPEPTTEIARRHHTPWLAGVFRAANWFWELDHDDGPLERAAVLLVALLTAFLTLVAVWQIPPTDSPLAKKPSDSKDKKDDTKGPPSSSPFSYAFAKTILAGLGGLVFADLAKALSGQKLSDEAKYFYIVCFVVFFLLSLIASSGIRALAEALRSRVTVYPLAPAGARLGRAAIWYWLTRGVYWFVSLKVPLLTFIDTFMSLVQGKNQMETKAFADIVVNQQLVLVRTADAIRKNLNDLIESRVREARNTPGTTQDSEGGPIRIRVNISVLSADHTSVFYISRTPGSSVRPFSKRSVAWVAVFTGEIRWFDPRYRQESQSIILLDNRREIIPEAEDPLMLSTYYQYRQDDYEAFVILPIPYPHRAYGANYTRGAIQISFGSARDFYSIWLMEKTGPCVPQDRADKALKAYPEHPQNMLDTWCKAEEVKAALRNSIVALSEMYRGFNEVIFQNQIEPYKVD